MVFMQPQRLIVPLFQRPYVWNQENQWEPLWDDVERIAGRILANPNVRYQAHFLGAVVLQQIPNPIGMLQQRTIIDGQQRLTTLQLLLDALRTELLQVGAIPPAKRIEALVANPEHFRSSADDQFKVWPTNRDRAAFRAVMTGVNGGADPERIADAHRYFRTQARSWLTDRGSTTHDVRAEALELVVRDLLQMVVIDLSAEENAQEIFETLNARGAQLTAADLIKNFIFQRLLELGANVETVYDRHWRDFETQFWEADVSVGRMRYSRSSIFLNHWLIEQTGEEIVAREIFSRFKTYADYEGRLPMPALTEQLHAAATVYRRFIEASADPNATDRMALFGYRTGVLESEVVKPVVLLLLDPQQPPIPQSQLHKALDVLESWMVRRMLVRATTKSYNQVVADIVTHLRGSDRTRAGDVLEAYLASLSSARNYWPDDAEIREELEQLVAYRRLGRGRLRMVLEAVEDHLRGWRDGESGLGGQRVARGQYVIEHVMPRKWVTHWPAAGDAAQRERLVHTLGNLTLLTSRLNSKASNGPWAGATGKRNALEQHDVLLLNRDLLRSSREEWTDDMIRSRTRQLIDLIVRIWPVPLHHRSGFAHDRTRPRRKITLTDLMTGGALAAGTTLHARRKRFADTIATVLMDGRIEITGRIFDSPSEAAVALTGKPTNGWWFFLVDPVTRRSLRDVRTDYIADLDVEPEDDDEEEDEEN
jgi:hypothetical protein